LILILLSRLSPPVPAFPKEQQKAEKCCLCHNLHDVINDGGILTSHPLSWFQKSPKKCFDESGAIIL
jgi:hypothetical protein